MQFEGILMIDLSDRWNLNTPATQYQRKKERKKGLGSNKE